MKRRQKDIYIEVAPPVRADGVMDEHNTLAESRLPVLKLRSVRPDHVNGRDWRTMRKVILQEFITLDGFAAGQRAALTSFRLRRRTTAASAASNWR